MKWGRKIEPKNILPNSALEGKNHKTYQLFYLVWQIFDSIPFGLEDKAEWLISLGITTSEQILVISDLISNTYKKIVQWYFHEIKIIEREMETSDKNLI